MPIIQEGSPINRRNFIENTFVTGAINAGIDRTIYSISSGERGSITKLIIESDTATIISIKYAPASTIFTFHAAANTPYQFDFEYPGLTHVSDGTSFLLAHSDAAAINVMSFVIGTAISFT